MWSLLLQTAVLLMAGQVVLGGIGYLTHERFFWAGLLLLIVYVWYVVRISKVLRNEIANAQTRMVILTPWRVALGTALVWQIPAVAALPYWAPEWATQIWQGVWLPVTAALGQLWSGVPASVNPWLWTALAVEALLVVLVAAPPRRAPAAPVAKPAPALAQAVSGEWSPAKRHHDVVKKGRRLK